MRRTVSAGSVPAGISVITAFSPKYASPQPTAEAATASAKTLHEELSDQAAARRTQCDAHGDLAFAGRRARQQQVGDVTASDQE